MAKPYKTFKQLDLPAITREVAQGWENADTFGKSVEQRSADKPFTFFEGPPSANGVPGIHHVMARTIKDIICRFKTQQGYRVLRKAGWDTHGLPVELQVEKELGITKEDIGNRISVEEYNEACKKSVMRYTDEWNRLTKEMGYWVDMENPYITYTTPYMETVWWLLKQFFDKGLLYKGYTIQPYSPAAGTGLSTHELNQPGAYREVKDLSMVAMFRLLGGQTCGALETDEEMFCLAWTTTPWTLPSNTALAVGPSITYCWIETLNPYTRLKIKVCLAEELVPRFFLPEMMDLPLEESSIQGQKMPWKRFAGCKGSDLAGLRYEQLLPYVQPDNGDAFRILGADFVRTEDGTGIVHLAPSFGADDFRAAQKEGIGSLTLVDSQGRFVPEVTDFAGEYVKEAFLSEKPENYESVDLRIALKLKGENRAFRIEKYEHNYPHCWRTDKPILYYPLDSWFIRTTALKPRLLELNSEIRWKPESTGTGRFGHWLENLVDWNLSRSRFWGIPLPIWRSKDGSQVQCIGSVQELMDAVDKSVSAGLMERNPFVRKADGSPDLDAIDLHRHVVDAVVLAGENNEPLYRENDLIDVWFDSGAMPYAQWHYPFENKELIDSGKAFPADFIAEGVDQTRGWFFTLHVIAAGVFDSVAYKSVISNGLVLDKFGQKMSKRLGNAVDPFVTMEQHGADALRWYMICNAAPWENLKFDEAGIDEVKRKFLGTLYNTYGFFALYANVDGVNASELQLPENAPVFDRWMLSRLRSLCTEVERLYEEYELTQAGRAIQEFVTEELSNWYVRLSRRRFWKGEKNEDKLSAYYTLYHALDAVSKLMAPIAPFFADWLYSNLHQESAESVHLALWPDGSRWESLPELESAMDTARTAVSLALSLRKKERIRVRQPLQRMLIPMQGRQNFQWEEVGDLIRTEVNVKELEFLSADSGFLVKQAKADFKKLGPKYGKQMKELGALIAGLSSEQIVDLEARGSLELDLGGGVVRVLLEEVEIVSQDVPGWAVASEGSLTVALDLTLTEELIDEGTARDFVNRVQNLRKESGLEVTDRIHILLTAPEATRRAIERNLAYICAEVLADSIQVSENQSIGSSSEVELDNGERLTVTLQKLQNQ